ncbi:NAD-dependent epimerase/dehydratase family protein [Nocardioides mangrovi]|uniref:NAD-dependent epimerase/dehydratase family protein n=1 Tax=Nocardioides mangrovi TaxID=2874580 RepID=A0ABS7U9Y5_9ACTN|nr:NAD-dependent epimerase/dehydratase family protein [Nocardioides mangrovi]MBZ5737685.1 NAD-dependent epimerase/dehydratase family protein [Nocardioides mangrovi]
MSRILVTGGSGYLGSHTIVAALRAGYDVRATVRDLARTDEVRATVGADVEVVAADLMDDAGWAAAVDGVDGVLHVASPIPLAQPEDPDELVVPAREGTLRVLRAARAGGVRRVVLTSSFAAIGYGRSVGRPWTEDDWTEPGDTLAPYPLSKVVAERAAWDDVAEHGAPELVVLNPTGIFGPLLSANVGSSAGLVIGMLGGRFAEAPRQSFGIADVRDVAEAHVRALEVPEAAGRRFLLTSPPATSWLGLADTLRERFGELAAQAPTREVDGDPVPVNEFDVSRARAVLGWDPRPSADTIADTVTSLQRVGLLA